MENTVCTEVVLAHLKMKAQFNTATLGTGIQFVITPGTVRLGMLSACSLDMARPVSAA